MPNNNYGKRVESDFQAEICRSVSLYDRNNNTDLEYFKFEDGVFNSRYYDCEIIGNNRQMTCLELKCEKRSLKTLNFRKLFSNGREKEIHKLLRRERQGFKAFVLVNHYNKKARINNVYVFNPMEAHNVFYCSGSIKVGQIGFPLPRIKDDLTNKYVWDITSLL